MKKFQNLKQDCLNIFDIRMNNEVFCDKKLRYFQNKFENAIV